jgi:hypothetical protein
MSGGEEKVFYDQGNVLVSNKRVVSQCTTYTLQNTASVGAGADSPGKMGGILVILIGLASFTANPFFGVPVIVIGVWYLYKRRKSYLVVLRDASGETNALRSYDWAEIERIVSALNHAIVERA